MTANVGNKSTRIGRRLSTTFSNKHERPPLAVCWLASGCRIRPLFGLNRKHTRRNENETTIVRGCAGSRDDSCVVRGPGPGAEGRGESCFCFGGESGFQTGEPRRGYGCDLGGRDYG